MLTLRRRGALAPLLSLVLTLAPAPLAHAASGVLPSEASPIQREEAQAHFARGHDLYTAKRFEEAAGEFAKSYAVVASPNALLFLARCDRERGKIVTAYAELGRTAAEAKEHAAEDPRYAKTAEAAAEERDSLAAELGFVSVTVQGGSPDAVVTIGSERVPRAALGELVPVVPGRIDLSVESPGRPPVRQSLHVSRGERAAVTLDGGPVPPEAGAPQATSPPPVRAGTAGEPSGAGAARTWAYVAGGVGVVGVATFAIAGVASNGTYSDLQTKCGAGRCPGGSGYDGEISRGKTEQTIANVGLVVGAVGVAAAATFFVVSLSSKSDRVAVVAGPGWLGLRGVF